MSIDSCAVIQSIFKQKRKQALYNVPITRLTPVSPYPIYTQEQLNMRRKVEILKYSNNRQNTKQNNLTQKQQWALLANGKTQVMSQTKIQKYASTPEEFSCPSDNAIPTLTTACDVPGPPMILQYDATIPLYKFVSDFTRSYVNTPNTDTSPWRIFTKNEVILVESLMGTATIIPDPSNNTQTDTQNVGVIVITDYMGESSYNYSVSIPVGCWFMGVQHTLYDYYTLQPYYDASNNIDTDYLDRSFLDAILNNSYVNLHVSNVAVEVYYNDDIITLDTTPTVNYSFQDVSFNIASLQQSFYAIQYVGNVSISNLQLPTQSGYVYDIKLKMTYTYDHSIVNVLRAFQSGFFTNLSSTSQNVQVNCVLNSGPPSGYMSGSFIQ
jgi:hypothetical protein